MRISKRRHSESANATIMDYFQKLFVTVLLVIPLFVFAKEVTNEDVTPAVEITGEVEGSVLPDEVEQQPIVEIEPEATISIEKDYSVDSLKKYAEKKVIDKWGVEHVASFNRVIMKESSWVVNTAHYKDGQSSAFGLAGFLNATWKTVGCKKTSDQYVQIDCAIKYISERYGTPQKALKFHDTNGYY